MTEVWRRLGADMRALRVQAGRSLRQAETASGWGRGTLSQVENGKARPSRALVDWYEAAFDGDGLLVSTFAEARGAHRAGPSRADGLAVVPGDGFAVDGATLPHGQLVPAGADLEAGWTFVNTGDVAWQGRRLRRVGTHSAAQLLSSPRSVAMDDCRPGGTVSVRVPLHAPETPGTLAAYWSIVDEDDRRCYPAPSLVDVLVVVR